MWRYAPFSRFLLDCLRHPLVKDCVIINNLNSHVVSDSIATHDKVIMLDMGTNCFVNPSWNLGVMWCTGSILCFLNDDVVFDIRVFDLVASVRDEWGMMGWLRNQPWDDDQDMFLQQHVTQFPDGVGRLFFVKRQNWVDVPPEIQINYGDFFLWRVLSKSHTNYFIRNLLCHTPDSQTTQLFTHVYAQETEHWIQIAQKWHICEK